MQETHTDCMEHAQSELSMHEVCMEHAQLELPMHELCMENAQCGLSMHDLCMEHAQNGLSMHELCMRHAQTGVIMHRTCVMLACMYPYQVVHARTMRMHNTCMVPVFTCTCMHTCIHIHRILYRQSIGRHEQ